MTNFTANQIAEIAKVVDSNVNWWSRPVVNIKFSGVRFVHLDHGDGRYTSYRWDGEMLRLHY